MEDTEEWACASWERSKRFYNIILCQSGKRHPFSTLIFILEIAANKASTVLVAQRGQGSQCCETALWVCPASTSTAGGGFGCVLVKANGLELGGGHLGQGQRPYSLGSWALDPYPPLWKGRCRDSGRREP